jgi:hypothetical protein
MDVTNGMIAATRALCNVHDLWAAKERTDQTWWQKDGTDVVAHRNAQSSQQD